MPFNRNIFINCPFDEEYEPILKAMIFCIVYLEYKPLLSETRNSAESRISGILDLVENAKYSIHDLSRMESTRKNELARFNMPFELGIDIGCKRFGNQSQKEKNILILDKIKYRYQNAISYISGSDISIHNEEPEKAIQQVRNWIRKIHGHQIASANKIWRLYNEFKGDFFVLTQNDELSPADIREMPWGEYCYYIQEWITGRKEYQ